MIDFNRSFASSPRAGSWDYIKNVIINKETPCKVFKSSNKKFWFNCGECEHSFESSLGNVTNNGTWCPYCANQKLCEDTNCIQCHEKSFESSPKAEFWDYVKNVKTSREVFKSSGEKF